MVWMVVSGAASSFGIGAANAITSCSCPSAVRQVVCVQREMRPSGNVSSPYFVVTETTLWTVVLVLLMVLVLVKLVPRDLASTAARDGGLFKHGWHPINSLLG